MTTVRYGDRYPVAPEARGIAALSMAAGGGVSGTFSDLGASWFLAPAAREADAERAEIKGTPQRFAGARWQHRASGT
jgi:hypothetical protein